MLQSRNNLIEEKESGQDPRAFKKKGAGALQAL